MDSAKDADAILIQQWIALNALYGIWDEVGCEPVSDRQAWRLFVKHLLSIDLSGHIADTLIQHKGLVLAILKNTYLTNHFWTHSDPQSTSQRWTIDQRARALYQEKQWPIIVEDVLDRIYLLRCQLIHGAATCGSKMNRDALRHCTRMLGLLITAALRVWIDHGANEHWGSLCYPPR
jgi:hypothetical protein